ncbi:MAG: hypothetical protein ACLFMM_00455 [Methanohalobium sp.]|uniref:hypothetical protein n=1 Tax=Methanohalobium sp. TaxID=2837493 RepID=UPI00397B4D90
MEMITITSMLVFGIYSLLVLLLLINVSSMMAILLLIIAPVGSVLIIPEAIIGFLTHQHIVLANGLVPVNNLHILLIIWSTLTGLILYTEFLTWYLSRSRT